MKTEISAKIISIVKKSSIDEEFSGSMEIELIKWFYEISSNFRESFYRVINKKGCTKGLIQPKYFIGNLIFKSFNCQIENKMKLAIQLIT